MKNTNAAEWIVWTEALATCANELRISCLNDGAINEGLAHDFIEEADSILECLADMATTDE